MSEARCGRPQCRHPSERHVALRPPGPEGGWANQEDNGLYLVCLDCPPRPVRLTSTGQSVQVRICPMGSLAEFQARIRELEQERDGASGASSLLPTTRTRSTTAVRS